MSVYFLSTLIYQYLHSFVIQPWGLIDIFFSQVFFFLRDTWIFNLCWYKYTNIEIRIRFSHSVRCSRHIRHFFFFLLVSCFTKFFPVLTFILFYFCFLVYYFIYQASFENKVCQRPATTSFMQRQWPLAI